MNDIIIWIGLAVIVLVFIAWIAWDHQPEKVTCTNRSLTKKYKGKNESIEITNIAEIKYHYHAVVGFLSTWEFVGKNGSSLKIDGEAKDITGVLSQLEHILPNFSLGDFKKKFEAGDVEDTINVWKNA